MVAAVEKAKAKARKALEGTYDGICTVIERQYIKDEKTKIKRLKEIEVIKDQPCHVSFEKVTATVQTETAATTSQGIKLFLPPEITIKSGSKIIVDQNGIYTEYTASSVPAVYVTHQEIMLEMFKEWT